MVWKWYKEAERQFCSSPKVGEHEQSLLDRLLEEAGGHLDCKSRR